MNAFAWILVGWFALGAIVSIAMIGKRRQPATPGSAVVTLVLTAVLIWLVFMAVAS